MSPKKYRVFHHLSTVLVVGSALAGATMALVCPMRALVTWPLIVLVWYFASERYRKHALRAIELARECRDKAERALDAADKGFGLYYRLLDTLEANNVRVERDASGQVTGLVVPYVPIEGT